MPEVDRLLHDAAPVDGLTADVVGERLRRAIFGEEEPAPPPVLGRYTPLERIGAGGMGTVWAAWDAKLERRVALKVLRPERGTGDRAARRLLREAKALARLSDPNVVAVFDVLSWQPDDGGEAHIVLAMEHVSGTTLRQWLDGQRRSTADIVGMFAQAARGIAAAHAAGVVHRDFKPSNVIVSPDGRARVVDFGLADLGGGTPEDGVDTAPVLRPLDPPPLEDDTSHPSTETPRERPDASLAGAGTPKFMAPEQHRGGEVDARCDQYALCVALWEALHGQPPFSGTTFVALLDAKLTRPPDPGAVRIPGALHRALIRGLDPDPARRWPDVPALLTALVDAPRRRRRQVLAGLSLVAVGGVTAIAWPRLPACDDNAAALAGIWNGDRASTIASAFSATGLAYAPATWATTRGELDGFASAWLDAHRDACEDHRAGEQSDALFDRRMACLDDRRRRLDALLDVFTDADADVVTRGVSAVQQLPTVRRCADVDALLHSAALPDDPQAAEAVEALQRRLAQARAQIAAGHYADALTEIDAIEADATGIEHVATLADIALARGEALGFLGRSADARTELVRAARAAERGGADELFARATTGLVWEVGDGLRELSAADDWAALAEGALARIGEPPELAYLLGNAIATVDDDRGDPRAAAARFEHELVAVERVFGPDDYRAFVLRGNLANEYLHDDRLDDALAQHTRAIAIGTAALGEAHPRVLMARNNRVAVLQQLGRIEEAYAEIDRVVALEIEALGEHHLDTATARITRAILAGDLERWTQTRDDATAALSVLTELEPDSLTTALGWRALARAQRGLGAMDEARASGKRALAIATALYGDRAWPSDFVELKQWVDSDADASL